MQAAQVALGRAGFTLTAGPIPLASSPPHPQRLFRATKVSGTSHVSVDLLEVSESSANAFRERQSVPYKNSTLWTVTVSGLLDMKRTSTRLKDLADVEMLEESNL